MKAERSATSCNQISGVRTFLLILFFGNIFGCSSLDMAHDKQQRPDDLVEASDQDRRITASYLTQLVTEYQFQLSEGYRDPAGEQITIDEPATRSQEADQGQYPWEGFRLSHESLEGLELQPVEEFTSVAPFPPPIHRPLVDQELVIEPRIFSTMHRSEPKKFGDSDEYSVQSPDWRYLGFATYGKRIESGIDRRVRVAFERYRERGFVYVFLILNQQLSAQHQRALGGLGIELFGPHSTAQKASMPIDDAILHKLVALDFVEWVGQADPEQKVDSLLQSALTLDDAAVEKLPVFVNLFDEFSADDAKPWLAELRKMGVRVIQYDTGLGMARVLATRSEINRLSQQDFVLYMELDGPTTSSHDTSIPQISSDYIRSVIPGSRFDGEGVVVGNMGGVMATHVDLYKAFCGSNVTRENGPYHPFAVHGTHVLGTIAGTGTAEPRYRGVAPAVGDSNSTPIRVVKWANYASGKGSTSNAIAGLKWMRSERCDGFSPQPDIVNYSGGRSEPGSAGWAGTDKVSRVVDRNSSGFKILHVNAAGNDGFTGSGSIVSPATAKTALAVGVFCTRGLFLRCNRGGVPSYSSKGPTGDGRIKPDVVAPGDPVTSLWANTMSNDQYLPMSGTSMAAPHVAGLAATLMDHYPWLKNRPYYVRALIMATSQLAPGQEQNQYGHGRVSSYLAHWSHPTTGGWETFLGRGDITSKMNGVLEIDVPEDTNRLHVVLTWDEPPASSGADAAVIYDLDLLVDCLEESCEDRFSASYVDNVEFLEIVDPEPGRYRLIASPHRAPDVGVPAAIAATVIRGSPDLVLTTPGINSLTPQHVTVGDVIDIKVRIDTDGFVVPFVFLRVQSGPNSTLLGCVTWLEDGTPIEFTSAIGLGEVVQGNGRLVKCRMKADQMGGHQYQFEATTPDGLSDSIDVNVLAQPLPQPD